MKKICVVCGKEFESKTDRAKYCCVVCKNHSRYKRTRTEFHADVERERQEVIELFNSGTSLKDIASQMGKSYPWAQQTVLNLGLGKQLTPLQRQIKKLRLQGLCSVEIADILGKDSSNIVTVAKKIGMPFSEEEKQRSIRYGVERCHTSIDERTEKSRQYIEKNRPGFEYVSGFINSDDYMTLKCLQCGSIIRKSAITLRSKNKPAFCPVCQENERLQKKREAEAERQRQQEKREEEKEFAIFNKEFQQETFKRCECCGSLFFGNNSKYCSSECAKRIYNGTHKDKRIKKMRSVVVDKNITLEKLYKRDSGRCWLCGGQCDWSDHQKTKEGYFIVGKNYPSQDHVIPLSKGGLHSWDNVKLAHFYCNSIRGNKAVCS